MSKTNVHKTAEELYSASAGLAEKLRGTRQTMLSELNALRDLETRIKAQAREAQQQARAAQEEESRAQAEAEAMKAAEPLEAPEKAPAQTAEAVRPSADAAPPKAEREAEPKPPEPARESEPDKQSAPPAIKSQENIPAQEAAGNKEPVLRPQAARQAPATPSGQDAQARPANDPRRAQPAARPVRPENRNDGRPPVRSDARPVQPRPPFRGTDGRQPQAPRDGAPRYAGRNDGAAPRTGAPDRRPAYPPRQGGQGGYDRRPAEGGGYAPRPTGQGQPRPGGQGYAPRTGRPADGSAPRGARPGVGGRGPANPLNPKALAKELAPVQEKEKASNYNPNKKAFVREKDLSTARAKKNKKQLLRDQAPSLSDEDMRFRKKRRKQMISYGIEKKIIDHAVITTEMVPIKVLAERIGIPGSDIIKKLLMLGIMANINQEIDFDTAVLIAGEFHVSIEQKLDKTFEEVMMDSFEEDDESNLVERPPVVTIMGHVDHGKTSLLDVIRKSHVTATEAGGITQHIGAYRIEVNGKSITFLDTPGHEAFTAMRSRGAQATDIAVLVVAADDGVMPQTVEAINHAKAAKVPIIVAINKMDLPAANPERVKRELMEYGLVPEEWGGENMMVEVSAQTHQGIDQLLESILVLAEVEDLTANPDAKATGTVIEAKLDRGRGPVATVLINNGTLRIGETIVAGTTSGRIRDMFDDAGNHVEEATPSMPVEIVGFSQVPEAGDVLHSAEGDKLARRVAQERQDKIKSERMRAASKVTLDDLFTKISEGEMKTLNIIIRGDVQGSVEAVKQALEKLSTEEVKIQCIHDGVGAITENDVMLASASGAIIVGFNIRPDANGREAADREKVDVRLYRIIYNAVEDMEKAIKGMLAPEFKESVLGHAQVRDVFKITGVGSIAGGYVTDGVIRRNAKVRVLRDSVVVHEGVLMSLKRFKDDVREVASGYECGIGVSGFNDIKENDVIEAFAMEEIVR